MVTPDAVRLLFWLIFLELGFYLNDHQSLSPLLQKTLNRAELQRMTESRPEELLHDILELYPFSEHEELWERIRHFLRNENSETAIVLLKLVAPP